MKVSQNGGYYVVGWLQPSNKNSLAYLISFDTTNCEPLPYLEQLAGSYLIFFQEAS